MAFTARIGNKNVIFVPESQSEFVCVLGEVVNPEHVWEQVT